MFYLTLRHILFLSAWQTLRMNRNSVSTCSLLHCVVYFVYLTEAVVASLNNKHSILTEVVNSCMLCGLIHERDEFCYWNSSCWAATVCLSVINSVVIFILMYLCESGQCDCELSIQSDSLHTQCSKIDTTSDTCAKVRSHDKVKGEGSTE